MSNLNKNIVLIGMPGSGKTTIGKILSKRMALKFVDMDEYIEETTGQSIKEIFKHGEDYFRKLESQVVIELSKKNSTVIATGGGVIKNYLNIETLKETGIIIFLDRPVENIAQDINMSNRPLLKDGIKKLYAIFNERYELYKKYCDYQVKNDKKIDEVVEDVIEKIVSNFARELA